MNRQTAIHEALVGRSRLAQLLEIVRAKADDANDPEQIEAIKMLSVMERELAETDAGLRRVGIEP